MLQYVIFVNYWSFEKQSMRIIGTFWKHYRAGFWALKKGIIGRRNIYLGLPPHHSLLVSIPSSYFGWARLCKEQSNAKWTYSVIFGNCKFYKNSLKKMPSHFHLKVSSSINKENLNNHMHINYHFMQQCCSYVWSY